jgi:hypothetical protein
MIAQNIFLLLMSLVVLGFGFISLKTGKMGNLAMGRPNAWGYILLTGNTAKIIAVIYVVAGICMVGSTLLAMISVWTGFLKVVWGVSLAGSVAAHTLANIISHWTNRLSSDD